MATARYRRPPQAPPSFTATPESLIAEAKVLNNMYQNLMDKIVDDVKLENATFENTILPIVQLDNEHSLSLRVLRFYKQVSTDQDLRDASIEVTQLTDRRFIEASMREDYYKLFEAVVQKSPKLDPETQRYLDKEMINYVRNGLGIPAGPKRDRFKEILERLSQIRTDFMKNLQEENGGFWVTREEMEGIPDDTIDGLEKGIEEHEGKIRFIFKDSYVGPTFKFALNSELRKKLCIENNNKCNANVPLFKETIILRDEAARLLGYPNHASFEIETKIAKTTRTVLDFLGDLRTQLTPGGTKEIDHLKELKKADLKSRDLETSYDGNFYLWDCSFYSRLMVENEYFVDKQIIAEYFPLQSTIEGMLRIFEELFGLVFIQMDGVERDKISETGKGADTVWHEDVKLFGVWDDEGEGSAFSGYLYLDLHPRPGKFSHAANFNLQPGFIWPNGTRRYPATALVCNFSKPTPKKPSLLRHSEVITLFHELGHGIHDLVGRTIYAEFHGTSVVQDFVEAPSQMLEYWCWSPSQLKSLSNHYETGEKIPDDLIDKLIKTKHVNSAVYNLQQLHMDIFDMVVHTPKTHEEAKEMKISELYNELETQITGLKGPEALGMPNDWGHGQTIFVHLIDGYQAGLYAYLFSQTYSADIFHTFFASDPMDPREGRRYRHMVLEKGGSQDEMKTLEDYLGRKPSTVAFYRELGLEPKID